MCVSKSTPRPAYLSFGTLQTLAVDKDGQPKGDVEKGYVVSLMDAEEGALLALASCPEEPGIVPIEETKYQLVVEQDDDPRKLNVRVQNRETKRFVPIRFGAQRTWAVRYTKPGA